jgi:hypothetical protein
MTTLREAAQQALEALEGLSEPYHVLKAQDALKAALEQPEQATGKESLQVEQTEPEGGWQSAPSPQVTQRIADMPMSEYRRGVNDGFKLGLREGRIKAEDEMREQPEQPEQEPVAWKDRTYGNLHHQDFGNSTPLDTHPPRREWRGLSKDESLKLWGMRSDGPSNTEITSYARAVEATLKERNA